jgi:hypothetical protein
MIDWPLGLLRSPERRLGLMVDREAAERLKRLGRAAQIRLLLASAAIEDGDLHMPSTIDHARFQKLFALDGIGRAEGLPITGRTGIGKS